MKFHSIILYIVVTWKCICTSATQSNTETKLEVTTKRLRWLDLSPWELYVLNDVMIEISLMKCPSVNKPAARAIKDFITEAVKQAKFKEEMNSNFLPVYNNLVQCMIHLDEQSKNPGKLMRSAAAVIAGADASIKNSSEVHAEEGKGWISNAQKEHAEDVHKVENKDTKDGVQRMSVDIPESYTTTEKAIANPGVTADHTSNPEVTEDPRVKEEVAESEKFFADSMINLGEIRDELYQMWSSFSFGRFKRGSPRLRIGSKNRSSQRDASFEDALHKFQQMFLMFHQILTKSCPEELRPSGYFSAQLVREFLRWISRDKHSFTSASEKFFEQDTILTDVRKCVVAMSFIKPKVSNNDNNESRTKDKRQ